MTTVLAVDLQAALGGDADDTQAQLDAARADLPPQVELLDFDRAIAAQSRTDLLSEADLERHHVVAYLNTGGTTGAPKIAQWKDSNQVYNAWAISLLRDFSVGDAMLSGLPLFHANAIMATGLSLFACGAKLVQLTPDGYRNPGVIPRLWEFVQRFRASGFGGVPTVYATLLEQLRSQHDISSLRLCGCGASPMPAELFRKFKAATGVEIFEGYGLTEATCASTANPQDGDRRVGVGGHPISVSESACCGVERCRTHRA